MNRFAITVPEKYFAQIQRFSAALDLAADQHLNLFKTPYHATYEAMKGLGELFISRKIVIFISGLEGFTSALQMRMMKENFKVKVFHYSKITDALAFALTNEKQTLAIFFPLEHSVTAEINDFSVISQALSESKIFKLLYTPTWNSELKFFLDDPYCVILSGVNEPNFSLVLGTSKSRFNPILTEQLDWESSAANDTNFDIKLSDLNCKRYVNKTAVDLFESLLISESICLKILNSERFYDRTVIYFSDLDSSALELKDCFSLSPCLHGEKSLDWLLDEGVSLQMLRGGLVIPVEVLEQQGFESLLKDKVDALRKEQHYCFEE